MSPQFAETPYGLFPNLWREVGPKLVSAIALLLLLVLFTGEVSAAIVRSPATVAEREMGCDLVLEGTIAPGDAGALSNSLPDKSPSRLCLNSPGGSFQEAIIIINRMLDHDGPVSTAIADKASCLSACALVFMFGEHIPYYGGTLSSEGIRVDRRMHPGATLGFHAQALDIPDQTYQKRNVIQAWDVATKTIAELISIRATHKYADFFRDELLRAMLATPASSMYYVDTVSKAAQFDIEVYPVSVPNLSIDEGARNFCKNLLSNAFGFELRPDYLSGTGIDKRNNISDTNYDEPNLVVYAQPRRGTGTDVACNFLLYPSDPIGPGGNFWISNSAGFDIAMFFPAPQFMFFDPATKLNELPQAHVSESSVDDLATWLRNQPVVRNPTPQKNFEHASWCTSAVTASEVAICSSQVLNEIEIKTLQVYERIKDIEGVRQIARIRHNLRDQCGADKQCLERVMRETLATFSKY